MSSRPAPRVDSAPSPQRPGTWRQRGLLRSCAMLRAFVARPVGLIIEDHVGRVFAEADPAKVNRFYRAIELRLVYDPRNAASWPTS